MQQNIGLLDRYIRLVGGLAALAGSTSLRRHSVAKTALIAVGAMKVAEGITGWCPLMHACGIQTTSEGDQSANQHSKGSGQSTGHRQQSQGNQHNRHPSSTARESEASISSSSDSRTDMQQGVKETEAAVNSSYQ